MGRWLYENRQRGVRHAFESPMNEHFEKILKPKSTDAELLASIDPERLPQHIAVIMDGNGRWAKKRGKPRIFGHRAGADSVKAIGHIQCLSEDVQKEIAFAMDKTSANTGTVLSVALNYGGRAEILEACR